MNLFRHFLFIRVLVIGLTVIGVNACAQPPTSTDQKQHAAGRQEYQFICGPCHFSTSTGYGAFKLRQRLGNDKALLHQRADLTAELIRVAVRNGFGTMPALSMVEVTNEQLEHIVSYLTTQSTPAQ